ncbi:DUF5930 domain-containing protein [Amylibacter sp.]|nr:DUF5930 domain-containing protein [Amylibacter sp.]
MPINFATINSFLSNRIPEQRIYLRSDKTARYVRLTPIIQTFAGTTFALLFCWMVIATVMLAVQAISAKTDKEQAGVLQQAYESRLEQLSNERNKRSLEAQTSLERFYIALEQVSIQQSELLELEEQRRELGKGLNIMQRKLQDAIKSRDNAIEIANNLQNKFRTVSNEINSEFGKSTDNKDTLAFLSNALVRTSSERDKLYKETSTMETQVETLELDTALLQERGNQIFNRLEEAVDIALAPLSKVLNKKGINTKSLVNEVRRGYSGTGGAITPIETSSESVLHDHMSERASKVLRDLDEVSLLKLAISKVPLGHPVAGSHRFTSGFGYRKDPVNGKRRMHNGTDLAAPLGTKIVATGDGVVIFAGNNGGYGRLIKIRHSQGFITYYAHLHKINVKKGQKVLQGEKIGSMGNSGRSTGVHLHYEIRLGGKPINAINYMKATKNVF